MSSRSIGFWINIFFVGLVIVGLGKAVDVLTSAYNNMAPMGITSQAGSNTFFMLTIMFYAVGFLFLLASGVNIIINARNTSNNEEV
jgi:hypothetical protein